jgi:tetratricopeptide (TPR) repeat protein
VWHLAASAMGPDDEVALDLDEAAARAQRRGATAVAINALQRAAQLTSDPALHAGRILQAAEISFEKGRPEVALRMMGEMRELSLSSRDQARLLCLEAVLGAADTGDPLRLRSLVSAADDMRTEGESALSLRLLSAAAMRCYLGGDPGYEARHNVAEVVEKLDLPGDDAWVLRTLAYATPIERGAVLLDRLSRIAPGYTNDPVEMFNLGAAASILGACDMAAKFINAAIVEFRKRGHLALLAQALLVRAWDETHLGNLNLALPAAEEARRLGEESGQPIFQAGAHVTQAIQAALRGDSRTADLLASRVEAVAAATGTTALRAVVQLVRGLASLAEGNYEAAYDRLYRVFDPQDPAYHFTRYWAIGDIVEAAVHCGREESARRLLADMESIGEEAPLPCLHVGLAYARPLLAQEADAEPLFLSALARDLRSWPFFRGRLLLAYGSWLRRQRRLAESRSPLRVARETFDALGAVP